MKYFSLILISLFFCTIRLHAAATPEHISLTLEEKTNIDLIETVAKTCKLGISVDANLMDSLEDPITLTLNEMPWDSFTLILKKYFFIEITTTDKLLYARRYDPYTDRIEKFYDVGLHVKSPLNHPLISVDLPAMIYDIEGVLDEFGTETEVESDIPTFIEHIQSSINPDSWADEGVYIEDFYGRMVVTQTRENHDLIEKELLRLEHEAARQIIGRFYRLDNIEKDLGLILTAEKWAPIYKTCKAPNAVFIVLNNYQQNHFAGTQRPAIVKSDLIQGVHVPNVRIVSTGLSLCVQANATFSGVSVNTQLWATTHHNFPTTELTSSDGTVLMNIVNPQISADHCHDTRVIPNGGAAIYRFGDHAYALTMEVFDNRDKQ